MDAVATQANKQSDTMPESEDPTERWSGVTGKVMNTRADPPARWSVHKANMEAYHPDILEYYEDRRTGKIEGKPFEEWRDPISEEEAEKLNATETGKVERIFYAIDYNQGFTGRGGNLAPCALDVW